MIRSIWSNHHKRRPIIYGIDDLETRPPKCNIWFKLTNSPVIPSPDTFWHLRILKHVSDVYLYVIILRSQIPSKELRLLKTLLNRALVFSMERMIFVMLLMRKPTVRRCHISLVFTWWCKSLLQEWIGRRLWIHRRQWPGHCSQARGTGRDGGWTQTIETSANPEWNTFIEQMCVNHLSPSCYILFKNKYWYRA